MKKELPLDNWLGEPEGFKTKPKYLTHPLIPKVFHGVAPRTLLGDDWWYKKKIEVYQSTNFHCLTCGVSKLELEKGNLHAHEVWIVNYATGRCWIKEIIPVCADCHTFIHAGRLTAMYINYTISEDELDRILIKGMDLLLKGNIKVHPAIYELAKGRMLKIPKILKINYTVSTGNGIHYGKWVLRYGNKTYLRYDK